MNPRNTWRWVLFAGALAGFIAIEHRYFKKPEHGPVKILPNLRPAQVSGIQVLRPAEHLEIRAERTNDSWVLSKPIGYPAHAARIEALLSQLQQLTPATSIPASELRNRPKADEEFGFASPQASLAVEQGAERMQLLVGGRTGPGDQVYLQVLGVEAIYLVDADLLKLVPQTTNDWRDTTLVNLKALAFDRVAVTNAGKAFELQRDPTNGLWQISQPRLARADTVKIEQALEKLQNARIAAFVSDDPKPDLEGLGLQPPDLELAFSQQTNLLVLLQFGKTNNAGQVYSQRLGLSGIVAVSNDTVAVWRSSLKDFRDSHLFELTGPVDTIEVRGAENFFVQRLTNDTWRILPANIPADSALVKEFLDDLTGLRIVDFYKDIVTEPDLPSKGLAPTPVRQYILSTSTNSSPGLTNCLVADLQFGTNQGDKIFVRRPDESDLYTVKLADFQWLPAASWQLRDRQIWNFSEDDVVGVRVTQQGRLRHLLHKGAHEWALAPDSQGIIEPLAVDETVRMLANLAAVHWVAQGEPSRAQYGFTTNNYSIALELKNGDKPTVEFGGPAPSTFPYAAVNLDGRFSVFEFPGRLYHDYVATYLSAPP